MINRIQNSISNTPLKAATFFFDIGRDHFKSPRNLRKYVDDFILLANTLQCEILVVTSASLKVLIENRLNEQQEPTKAKIVFHILEKENLPFFKKLQEIKWALSSPAMEMFSLRDRILSRQRMTKDIFLGLFSKNDNNRLIEYLPVQDLEAPEYLEPQYLAAVLSKPEILRIAYEIEFVKQSEPIAFIDFGFGHGNHLFMETLKQKYLVQGPYTPGSIHFTKRLSDVLSDDVWNYAGMIDDAIIPTGFFVLDYEILQVLNIWWEHRFTGLLKLGLVPDDQVFAAMFAASHPSSVQICETFDLSVLHNLEKWLPIQQFLNPELI